MSYPIKADLIPVVRGVILSLKPFAKVHGSKIHFHGTLKSQYATYDPSLITSQLINILIKIIAWEKENTNLHVTLATNKSHSINSLNLTIDKIGMDASIIAKINQEINPAVINYSSDCNKVNISIPIEIIMYPPNYREKRDHSLIKPWYNEIRKRLTNHFKSIDNLEKAAAFRSEAEAKYLKKVNDLIQSRMHCETFHVEELAKSLNISRAQLFRKLKPLVQMSPGRYIRFVRLESAREILQRGSHNVTEAAFAVGFVNVSHFSRSFFKQFGFTPSQIQSKSP